MILEVIVTTVEDAIVAEAGGADRLELCISLDEGGITPSLGKIKNVINAVDIPVFVMLRPHGNSFTYTEEDFAVMLDDLRIIQLFGAKGIVFGALTRENVIDSRMLESIVSQANGLEIAFHRAFDDINNQFLALEKLNECSKITHVLTSGGPGKAFNNMEQLRKLIKYSETMNIKILVGSGVSINNAQQFLNIGAKELHVGSSVRFDESFHSPINIELVRKLKKIMTDYSDRQ